MKVLSPYFSLWPTGMYNKYLHVLMYSSTSVQRKSCLIARELLDFVIRLVNFVLNLPFWQMDFFLGNSHYRKTVINPAHENFFRVN